MSNIQIVSNMHNSSCCSRVISLIANDTTHRLKTGVIAINGWNIEIKSSDSIYTIANKINATKNKTLVEATIIEDKGKHRLILKTKNIDINIVDNNRILFSLYKSGMLGTRDCCFIQVLKTNSNVAVKINYHYTSMIQSHNPSNASWINGAVKQDLAIQKGMLAPVIKPKLPPIVITKLIHSNFENQAQEQKINIKGKGDRSLRLQSLDTCYDSVNEQEEISKEQLKIHSITDVVDILEVRLKNEVASNIDALMSSGYCELESDQFNDSLEKDLLDCSSEALSNFQFKLIQYLNYISESLFHNTNLSDSDITNNTRKIIEQIISRSYYDSEFLEESDLSDILSKPYHRIGGRTLDWLSKISNSLDSNEEQKNKQFSYSELHKEVPDFESKYEIILQNEIMSFIGEKRLVGAYDFLLSPLRENGMLETEKWRWRCHLYENFASLSSKTEDEVDSFVKENFITDSTERIKEFLSVFSVEEQLSFYSRLKDTDLNHIVELSKKYDLSTEFSREERITELPKYVK